MAIALILFPACADPDQINLPNDEGLKEHQIRLLDTAFEVASAIPVDPHMKDRSRAQDLVVQACLKLKQPSRAANYAQRIDDWQKGASLADVAIYCAQHELPSEAEKFIKLAEAISLTAEDWRKDVIKVKIAQAYTELGEASQAAQFETNVVESEQGKVALSLARKSTDKDFGSQIENLNSLIATQHLDVVRNALHAYTELYSKHYANADRRKLIEENIRSSWIPTPILVRIDLLKLLAEAALTNSDKLKAAEFVREAQALVDGNEWTHEHRLSMTAQLVALRYQSGEVEQAKADAKAAVDEFDQQRQLIYDIWRAGALRPMAEAMVAIGDQSAAQDLYQKALEEGAINPNSRPKAEDLSATCISMAKVGINPTEAMWSKIQEIKLAFGDPW